jgi:hypothetical protein
MWLIVLVAALLAAAGLTGAAEQPALSADEIMQRAVARAERQHHSMSDAGFTSRVESEFRSLDATGKVTKNEVTVSRRYPLAGALFDEVVERDGKKLSPKEARAEEKRKAEFVREVEKRRAAGEHPQPEAGPGVRLNDDLVSRYRLTLAGTGTHRGHTCWKIDFEPKSGKLPMRKRIDGALNKSTGRFWISQEDYGLVRLEFAMREPYKYWGGFLATINDTDATLEFDRVATDVWVPQSFDLSFDIKVLMMASIRRRLVRRWFDYQPAQTAAAIQ